MILAFHMIFHISVCGLLCINKEMRDSPPPPVRVHRWSHLLTKTKTRQDSYRTWKYSSISILYGLLNTPPLVFPTNMVGALNKKNTVVFHTSFVNSSNAIHTGLQLSCHHWKVMYVIRTVSSDSLNFPVRPACFILIRALLDGLSFTAFKTIQSQVSCQLEKSTVQL